jgi:hypothetical protein
MFQSAVTPGKPATEGATWRLLGLDPFAGEYYDIGTAPSREPAEAAAQAELERLELEQPTTLSGGQREGASKTGSSSSRPRADASATCPRSPPGGHEPLRFLGWWCR